MRLLAHHRARSRARRIVSSWVPPLTVLCVLLAGWYLVRWQVLQARQRVLLPAPHEVVTIGFFDRVNRGELLEAGLVTARVALVGLLIATAIGVSGAALMRQARWAKRSFYPYTVVLQTTPVLAITPLIGLWFEYGFRSRVMVCVLVSLFPIVTNTLAGLESVSDAHADLFRLQGASRVARLRRLDLMSALPSLFTGLRIAATWSVIGAVVSDFFFGQGDTGLGRLLDLYRGRLASEQLFATVIVSCALGLLFVTGIGVLTRACIGSWHESEHADG